MAEHDRTGNGNKDRKPDSDRSDKSNKSPSREQSGDHTRRDDTTNSGGPRKKE